MKLSELKPIEGSHKKFKRVGRGRGSGRGKTSSRGQKGQNARTGGGVGNSFEGGQMPLIRRIPKRGFKPIRKVEWEILSVEQLGILPAQAEITPQKLLEAGLIRNLNRPVKLLGDGKVDKRFSVKIHGITKSAKEKIEKAGGSVEVLKHD